MIRLMGWGSEPVFLEVVKRRGSLILCVGARNPRIRWVTYYKWHWGWGWGWSYESKEAGLRALARYGR